MVAPRFRGARPTPARAGKQRTKQLPLTSHSAKHCHYPCCYFTRPTCKTSTVFPPQLVENSKPSITSSQAAIYSGCTSHLDPVPSRSTPHWYALAPPRIGLDSSQWAQRGIAARDRAQPRSCTAHPVTARGILCRAQPDNADIDQHRSDPRSRSSLGTSSQVSPPAATLVG